MYIRFIARNVLYSFESVTPKTEAENRCNHAFIVFVNSSYFNWIL